MLGISLQNFGNSISTDVTKLLFINLKTNYVFKIILYLKADAQRKYFLY